MEQISVLKYLENIYLSKSPKPEVVKGLVIDKISKHKHGKYIKFFISNIDEFNFSNLLNVLYNLLHHNSRYKSFSRNKILDLKSRSGSKSVLISKDNRISNITSKDEFTRTIKRNILESGNLTYQYPQLEIIVWKERFKPINREGVKSLFNKYFKFLVKSKVKLIFAHNPHSSGRWI